MKVKDIINRLETAISIFEECGNGELDVPLHSNTYHLGDARTFLGFSGYDGGYLSLDRQTLSDYLDEIVDSQDCNGDCDHCYSRCDDYVKGGHDSDPEELEESFNKIYETSKKKKVKESLEEDGYAMCDICQDIGEIGVEIQELPNGQHLCATCMPRDGEDADYIDEEGYIRSQAQDIGDWETMEEEDHQQEIWKAAGLDDDSLDDMGNIKDIEDWSEDDERDAMGFKYGGPDESFEGEDDLSLDDIEEDYDDDDDYDRGSDLGADEIYDDSWDGYNEEEGEDYDD